MFAVLSPSLFRFLVIISPVHRPPVVNNHTVSKGNSGEYLRERIAFQLVHYWRILTDSPEPCLLNHGDSVAHTASTILYHRRSMAPGVPPTTVQFQSAAERVPGHLVPGQITAGRDQRLGGQETEAVPEQALGHHDRLFHSGGGMGSAMGLESVTLKRNARG
jgi:hypothetical protein